MRILYLDLDSLRPDHLGCYGYPRTTSPTLDHLAKQGTRFEGVYASDVPCAPSRTALMSGRLGIHTGLVGHGGTAGDMRPEGPPRRFASRLGETSLPAVLQRQGYHTASISSFATRHSVWTFLAGFDEVHNTGKNGMEIAEDVTPIALRWLAANATRDNWFLHVNYWDIHVPYRTPADFGNPFAADPIPAWLTADKVRADGVDWGYQKVHAKQHVFRRFAEGGFHATTRQQMPPLPRNPRQIHTVDDARMIIDGYDCGVRYVDEHVGRLLAALEKLGVADEVAIIISADHGENLGELSIYGDHITADEATCHIPLIIRWPGLGAGHVDSGLHYHLDLAPTLTDLLGLDTPDHWDGQSFAPALTTGQPCGRDSLVVSTGAGTCQRGVRFDDWLYIHTLHDGYNLFPDEMLFNVVADPHQQHDLAGARPEVCQAGARRLLDWQTAMQRSQPPGYSNDPLVTVIQEGGPSHVRGRLADYLKQLAADGGAEAVETLKQRHPREW